MAEEAKTTQTKTDSYFKDGEYREYTDLWGVYHGVSPKRHGVKGRLVSKHDSLDKANQAAKALFDEYDTKTAVYATSDFTSGCYGAQIAFFRSVIRIEVEELKLDKLNQFELKQLRATLAIENTDKRQNELSKKGLIDLLLPTIQHKKHQNEKQEKDIASCLMCRELYKDEYDALMKERDNNPIWKKQKIFTKMYRASLTKPITQKQIRAKYGSVLTDELLESAVLDEKLHWRTKSCFGNAYRVYEKDEIAKYYKELQEKQSKGDKKRKYKEMSSNVKDDESQAQEPETKKRKVKK